ncbi:unnamed protein product [Parnassius apollo]|uniref:(apollo) hypothetical protein n=2 Tax=Parnassius apollo TaxID=110799 RepID=A0A8S3WAV5_PARAO|nr:unnamed protein product [Parnassius apollo]CAG5001902.1 unnamed protein product [Parnassius apollo]
MSENFINAIQERPILWDKRNKNYHNRLLSYREWEDLAKLTGTTSETAKKKWKNLRDTFIKELKKIPKPRSGADADNEPKYTGTWPYFESMSFLIVILKPRKTEGNIVTKTDSNSRDLPESTDAASLEDDLALDVADSDDTQLHESMSTLQEMPQNTTDINTHQSPLPSPSLPAITRQTRKRKDSDLEAFLDIEREKMKILRQGQEDTTDDDILWFKSILPYIKQLPSMNKLHFRTQMQELLLTELSKLNPTQPGSQHGYYTSL